MMPVPMIPAVSRLAITWLSSAALVILLAVSSGVAAAGAASGATADDNEGRETESGQSCQMTEADQTLLERVNQARAEGRSCGSQDFPSAAPLTWNCKLEAAARAHSRDMAELDFFSHTGPDGLQIAERVDARSYAWTEVGENIAAGQQSPAEVVEGWLASPGHCANIMNGQFTEMGAARVASPTSRYSPFWTQVLARPR